MTPDFDREAFLARLAAMDETLVAAGFPPMSRWWWRRIEHFVRSGSRRWLLRVGRRGGKSTTMMRLAVAWAWFGAWHVPPGDTAIIPLVSVNRTESASRLRTIAAILDALGLRYEQRGDELELLAKRRVIFRTYACTLRAVVGFTAVAIFGDEVARWESRDGTANPAREVIGSLQPTAATQPHAPTVLCSSPWSTDDYHAELFDQGDTDHQVADHAPTWVANPTIAEEQTHELEPDQRAWEREYAAIPGATHAAAIDRSDVDACFGRPVPSELFQRFVTTDASSLRNDAWAWLCGGLTADEELVVTEVHEVTPAELGAGGASNPLSMAAVVDQVARNARRDGVRTVYGDQREEASLRAMFRERGLHFRPFTWSEPSKEDAMQLLRRLMRERRVILPEHDGLRTELQTMQARLMPSGREKYETHGLDFASCLITLCHAIEAGHYRMAKVRPGRWGFVIQGL